MWRMVASASAARVRVRSVAMPKPRSSAAWVSSSTSFGPKASGSGASMLMAPKISPSTQSGSASTEAIPCRMAPSRQGAVVGEVLKFRVILGAPLRMAVPVGPRPRAVSAQLMLSDST
ncbi:hypothetical protein FQZ97_776750 [compost metagenome]